MEKGEFTRKVILGKKNYISWAMAMISKMRNIDVLKYIVGCDPNVTVEKAEKTFCLIMRALDEGFLAFVINKDKGDRLKLWNLLKEKFVGSTIQARGPALDQLLDLKFKTIEKGIEKLR